MVYKLTAPEVKKNRLRMLMLCLPYGVLVVVIAAVMGVVMKAGMVMVFLVSLLVAASVVVLLYAHMVKTIRLMQEQGDWFVTATEAGLMIEKPEVGMTSYFSWELVEKVLLKKTLLFVCLKNGMKHFLPLASLGPERAHELHVYCTAHAGKPVPLEMQVKPPAELLSAPALPCADGAAARQEVADELARQRAPFALWALLVGLAIMVSGLVVQVWCWWVTGESDIESVVVPVVIALFCIRAILHPGWSLRKWVRQQARSVAYVHQVKILVHTPGMAWSMLPVSQVRGARELRYCYAYAVQGGGVLGISREVPPPSGLPRPVPVKRGRTWLALAVSTLVVPALVALGMWCWLSSLQDSVDDEAVERGAQLQMYVEEMLPPQEYPGHIIYCAYYADTQVLSIEWEEGLEVYLHLSPEYEEGQSEDCPGEEE